MAKSKKSSGSRREEDGLDPQTVVSSGGGEVNRFKDPMSKEDALELLLSLAQTYGIDLRDAYNAVANGEAEYQKIVQLQGLLSCRISYSTGTSGRQATRDALEGLIAAKIKELKKP